MDGRQRLCFVIHGGSVSVANRLGFGEKPNFKLN